MSFSFLFHFNQLLTWNFLSSTLIASSYTCPPVLPHSPQFLFFLAPSHFHHHRPMPSSDMVQYLLYQYRYRSTSHVMRSIMIAMKELIVSCRSFSLQILNLEIYLDFLCRIVISTPYSSAGGPSTASHCLYCIFVIAETYLAIAHLHHPIVYWASGLR